MGSNSRRLGKSVGFRVTDELYDELVRRADRSGEDSVAKYLRNLALEPEERPEVDTARRRLPSLDEKRFGQINRALQKLNFELNRIGNNYNQIAKHLNQNPDEFNEADREIHKMIGRALSDLVPICTQAMTETLEAIAPTTALPEKIPTKRSKT